MASGKKPPDVKTMDPLVIRSGRERRQDMTRPIAEPHQAKLVRRALRLEVVAGPHAGASAVSESRAVHLGTQPGNTLQLARDDAVSRIHVELSSTPAGIRLRDLSSTNGTWVGSARIEQGVVPSGSVIRVGQTQVRVTALQEVEDELSERSGFGELTGNSPAMRAIFSLLDRVAITDETVLITGETGTGKELCARALVAAGRRRDAALVTVDGGAIPPNLLESELFGHVRGAFTGAHADHEGAFERAHGGTIFFDEIGELPLALQSRLLRALENRTVRRVGGTADVPLDIRIIAATNRRLEEEVNRGTFRADLYYRLSVVHVSLPPLRERGDDVVLLAEQLVREMGSDPAVILDARTIEEIKRHSWPGNIRELRNYVRRMSLGERATLTPPRGNIAVLSAPDTSLSFKEAKQAAIADFERAYLAALLEETGGNVSEAARRAQTDRTYLARLLAKHGIR